MGVFNNQNKEMAEKKALLVKISELCTYMKELGINQDTINYFLSPKLKALVNNGKIGEHYLDSLQISLTYAKKNGLIDTKFIKEIANDLDNMLNHENSESPQVSSPDAYTDIPRKFRELLHVYTYTSSSDQNSNPETPPSRNPKTSPSRDDDS